MFMMNQPSSIAVKLPSIPSFKCVVIGDGGVGKTTFVQKHVTGHFEEDYSTTVGTEVHPMVLHTSRGPIKFDIWDTSAQEKYGIFCDNCYIHAACGIIMFDVTSHITYKNVNIWYRDVFRVCEKIPLVLCGNKVDVDDRKVKNRHIKFHRKKFMQYYDISAKTNYNIEKPFLWIARQLIGDPHLRFVSGTAYIPPQISLDLYSQKKLKEEIDAAKHIRLPEIED